MNLILFSSFCSIENKNITHVMFLFSKPPKKGKMYTIIYKRMKNFFQKNNDTLSRSRFQRILRDIAPILKIPRRCLGVGVVFFFVFVFFLPYNTHANTLTRGANNLGLVGYWSFNEGTSTSATDFSGYGNNGTFNNISNPPTNSSGWISGKLGKAVKFDGSNDFVSAANSSSLNLGGKTEFTLSAWVKVRAFNIVSNCDNDAIIAKGGDAVAGGYFLYLGDTGSCGPNTGIVYLSGGFVDGSAVVHNAGGANGGIVQLKKDTWYHLTVIYNGSTLKTYVNGVEDASLNTTATVASNSETLSIGANTNNGGGGAYAYRTNSIIDEVRIYNRAISLSELAGLYRSGVTSYKAPSNRSLVGWWPMEEGTSTMIADYSGNNNHGTTTGMAVPPTAFSGWTTGRLGKALNFDSENDRVDIPDSGSLNFGGITTTTFAAWVYLDSYPPSNDNYIYQIIGDESACAAGGSVIWRIGSQGSITYRARIGINFRTPTDHDDQNNTDLPLKTWTHIAVTTDGANARYYINGRLDTTNAYAFVPQSSTCSWSIGYFLSGNGRFFDGKIDDVRIYKRTLSAEEISALARLNQTAGAKAQTGVVPNGLVGYWSFGGEYMNWNNNRALDASPLGNDGTITNMSTSTSAVQGILGQSLKFDGVDDYVNVVDPANGSLDFDITSPLSISAWVNRATLGSSVGIVVKRMAVTSGYDFSIVGSNDHVQFSIGDNFGSNFRISNETANPISNPNQWYHVVVTYNGNSASSGINIYVDGVKQSLTNAFDNYGGGSTLSSDPFAIGARASGTERQFNGRIDEVRVYNRVLSDSEVLQLYRANR